MQRDLLKNEKMKTATGVAAAMTRVAMSRRSRMRLREEKVKPRKTRGTERLRDCDTGN